MFKVNNNNDKQRLPWTKLFQRFKDIQILQYFFDIFHFLISFYTYLIFKFYDYKAKVFHIKIFISRENYPSIPFRSGKYSLKNIFKIDKFKQSGVYIANFEHNENICSCLIVHFERVHHC